MGIKLIKGSLVKSVSELNREYNVELYLEDNINKYGDRVNKYGAILESGEHDEPYASKVGETYKFIEPVAEEKIDKLSKKLINMFTEFETTDQMADETMKFFKDEVKEGIYNKKKIPNRKRKNRTLIETAELVKSIKVTKEIVR